MNFLELRRLRGSRVTERVGEWRLARYNRYRVRPKSRKRQSRWRSGFLMF